MRIKLLFYAISVVVMAVVCQGYGGERTKKLQALHRQIGNNLIKIKKAHPQSQTLVYSVLDQLGKYYEFSKDLLGKKKKYKQLLKSELTSSELFKKDIQVMKTKMAKMKKMILSVHRKMKKDEVVTEQLQEEKATLTKEKEEFLKDKEQFDVEREKLIQERDELLQERDALLRDRPTEAKAKQPNQDTIMRQDAAHSQGPARPRRIRTRRREILRGNEKRGV